MITLYGAGEGFGLPEISPYVTKTEVQLQLADIAYRKVRGDREDSPKGQIPYIDAGDRRIADSTFIRDFIEQAHGVDLDAGLDAVQRAQAWAIERMCENHLCWVAVTFRWLDPDNFARGPAHFFASLPDAVRDKVIEDVLVQVRANVRSVGIGRHTPPEIVALGERSLAALSALIGDKPYLMGERPCGADATVFAMLAMILTPCFPTELRDRALGYANLVAYTDRLMAQFYPDFAWRAATPAEAVAA